MADNTTFTPGSGATLATDEITSVHHVYSKLEWGADGTATPVAAGVAALPIQDGGNSITVDGTLTAVTTVGTITNVVHIDDNSSTISIDDGGSSITVDGTVAFSNTTIAVTNAGTFAVQAAQSGTWNITNISGTVSLPTGAATAAKQPALGTAGTASTDVLSIQGISGAVAVKTDGSAVTQPVSIAAAVAVTDNSGSLTVDNNGTFAVQATCTNSGTFAVQATVAAGATNIAKAEDVASADADVGVPAMAVRKATPANTSGTDGDYEMLQMSAGRLWTSAVIDTALPAGTNAIGKLASNTGVTIGAVEIAATQTLATVTTVGTVTTITNVVHVDDNSGSLTVDGSVNLIPATSGGCTISSTLSSASSNTATSVKGSAGQLYGLYISNTSASARWLKFYNTASTPTGGSGTPVLRLLIPGNTSGAAGAFEFSNGIAFSSGIGFTITGAVADNDTTAISANEVIVNVIYK